jgi:hypothetical protein
MPTAEMLLRAPRRCLDEYLHKDRMGYSLSIAGKFLQVAGSEKAMSPRVSI